MAIDTRNKRASAINVGSPWRGMLPAPSGAIDQADRQTVALMYSGILAGAAQVVATLVGSWSNVLHLHTTNRRLELTTANGRLELKTANERLEL